MTYLVCKDAVLAFGPDEGQPIKTGQLERLEFTSCLGQVGGVFVDLDKCWATVDGVRDRSGRYRVPRLAFMELVDGRLSSLSDLVVG